MIRDVFSFLKNENAGGTLARYQQSKRKVETRWWQSRTTKIALLVAVLCLVLFFSQNEPYQLMNPSMYFIISRYVNQPVKYYWPQLIMLRPIYVRLTHTV
jgi:hypothetical protein